MEFGAFQPYSKISGDNSFNDFPENQLAKFYAVQPVLRQIGTRHSFVKTLIKCQYERFFNFVEEI